MQLERNEAIEVSDTVIVGESNSYRALMARQVVDKVCYRRKLQGIQLHTWQNIRAPGVKISNVTFTNVNNVACDTQSIFHFSDQVSSKKHIEIRCTTNIWIRLTFFF